MKYIFKKMNVFSDGESQYAKYLSEISDNAKNIPNRPRASLLNRRLVDTNRAYFKRLFFVEAATARILPIF